MGKRWNIKELKGQSSAVAYHAYMGLMLHLSMTKTAHKLLSEQKAIELTLNKADALDYLSSLFDAVRALPSESREKKQVFIELIEFADKEVCEYMKLLQIIETKSGANISSVTDGNFSAKEITHMLYDAWCACLDHQSEVFF